MNDSVIIKNIFYMLAYVFESIDNKSLKSLGSETFENIDDMLSGLLSVLMSKQIKKGINKDYIQFSEDLKVPRGKINFNDTIKSGKLVNKSVVCNFDEYSENNISNQIIKSTLVNMLRKNRLSSKRKLEIKKIISVLENVEEIDILKTKILKNTVSRTNKNYAFMLYICELYKNNQIFKESKTNHDVKEYIGVKSFHQLFENFVLNYFRKEHPILQPTGINMRWDTDSEQSLLPMLKTDITLFGKDHVLIIDTKYYGDMYSNNMNTTRMRASHINQIFAYVYNYANKESIKTSGMLLYAQTKHEKELDVVERVGMYDLYFKSLKLNTDFINIKQQLDDIASLLY